jgi:hypothetical protein
LNENAEDTFDEGNEDKNNSYRVPGPLLHESNSLGANEAIDLSKRATTNASPDRSQFKGKVPRNATRVGLTERDGRYYDREGNEYIICNTCHNWVLSTMFRPKKGS